MAAQIEWEETSCPLCHQDDAIEVLSQPAEPNSGIAAYRLVQCCHCGLGYLNPRPSFESIGHFYPEDYGPYQHSHQEKRGAGKRKGEPHSFLPISPPGRLLDYGCGSGAYLQIMRDLGWDVVGIDMSRHGVEATARRGIPAYQGVLPHPAIPPGTVDVVNFGAVLEHVHDPHELIAAARDTVRPGGLVVFSVPHFGSWGHRVFGGAWWPLELPRHLLHFNVPTLEYLVGQHDLEILEVRMPPRTNWMQKSIQKAKTGSHRVPWFTRVVAKMMQLRILRSGITRFVSWLGQGDCIMLIARRPLNRSALPQAA